MDVFSLRNRLVSDYASYVQSFIHLRDPLIGKKVNDSLTKGLLWPDPLIQLNPAFEPGEWIEELVADRTLHPECNKIFRIKPEKVIGETLKRSTPEACFNVAKGLEAIVNDATAKKPFVKITQYKKVA